MTKSSTHDLQDSLLNIHDEKSLEQYMQHKNAQMRSSSFAAYFLSLSCAATDSLPAICHASGIERTYFYHILSGTKQPGRDKILRICIASHLSIEETNKALTCGEKSILYVKNVRDALILYAINNHLSVMDTNELLDTYDQPVLA